MGTTVGRTHIIVRFQTGNRRKDHGTENFGGFVYVLDRFPQRELGLWVFMYPCLLYTSPSPRDRQKSRMPSSA